MINRDDARTTFLSLTTLPTLPTVITNVIRCVEAEDSTAQDLKNIILNDQSIAVKILSVANSAHYGLSHQVSDLQQAVVVLGFEVVRDIALYVSFGRFFSIIQEAEHFDLRAFWKHSIGTAEAARQLAQQCRYDNPERALILGLIHDIGKVAINHAFHAQFQDACRTAREESITLDAAERQALGFDHCEVGSWLAEKWNLPDIIIAAIEYHHTPEDSPPAWQSEIMLTHVADCLARQCQMGSSGNPVLFPPVDLALRTLGLDAASLEQVARAVQDAGPQIDKFLNASM